MKTTKLLVFAAALTGLATLSFAGVAPDYSTRMNDAAKRAYQGRWAASNVTAPAKAAPAPAVAATCTACQGCVAKKS